MSAAAYRARSATELIDATFQLLRKNFPQFYTLAALFYVPIAVIPRLFTPTSLQSGDPAAVTSVGASFFVGFIVFVFLFVILSAIFQTAMYYACSDAYLGKPVDIADVVKRGIRHWGTMAGGFFLQGLAIGVATLFFIIPGIIVFTTLFAVPCVIAFENTAVLEAFSRSGQLSKGLKGHIFLTMLLAGAIYFVGAIIVYFIANLIAGGLGRTTVLSQTVITLGTSLIFPLLPLAITLLYYDARIRKEGFDIELMAQQVGGPAAEATKPQPA